MKFQSLFSGEIKKNIINLLSAGMAKTVVRVKALFKIVEDYSEVFFFIFLKKLRFDYVNWM